MKTDLTYGLTGDDLFDGLLQNYADCRDSEEQERHLADIWDRFGTTGTVLITDMAGFSRISRRSGICHYLKLILHTRRIIAPIIEAHNGRLLKGEADNCFAFFDTTDDAIAASLEANAAVFEANRFRAEEDQVYLSVGIDRGRLLLIDGHDFFGDPVNTASKLGEDLAVQTELLVTERALADARYPIPETAEHLIARISGIEIEYLRLPMVARARAGTDQKA